MVVSDLGPIADVHLFAVMGMDRRDGRYGGRFRRERRDIRPLLGELQRVLEVWGGLWVDRPLGRLPPEKWVKFGPWLGGGWPRWARFGWMVGTGELGGWRGPHVPQGGG